MADTTGSGMNDNKGKEMTSEDLAWNVNDTMAGNNVQHNTNEQEPQLKNTGDKVLNPDAQKPNHRTAGDER